MIDQVDPCVGSKKMKYFCVSNFVVPLVPTGDRLNAICLRYTCNDSMSITPRAPFLSTSDNCSSPLKYTVHLL